MKEFYKKGNYRIIIESDCDYDTTSLKGDMFKPECNPHLSPDILLQREYAYLQELESEGVYIATLEKWNPEVGEGWTMIDCIGGFVGDSFKGSGFDTEWIELIEKEIAWALKTKN